MTNDESNRRFSLVEVCEFKEWCSAAHIYIEKCQDSAVSAKGPWWIDNYLDDALGRLGECIDWARRYEETLKESE